MIVDLNLQGRKVVVIGGGNESLKRIKSLLKQNCEITIISESISPQINRLVRSKKIKLVKQNIKNISFISKYNPSLIITTTDDKMLNQKIIKGAKKRRIIVYSSDNPEESDFSNPAIIDFENTIQIAIFTGGKSPAMSKRLKEEAEKIFKKIITKKDISQIKLQKIVREKAKKKISTQIERKEYLKRIMEYKEIDQLIKAGQMKKAEKRADTILRDWK